MKIFTVNCWKDENKRTLNGNCCCYLIALSCCSCCWASTIYNGFNETECVAILIAFVGSCLLTSSKCSIALMKASRFLTLWGMAHQASKGFLHTRSTNSWPVIIYTVDKAVPHLADIDSSTTEVAVVAAEPGTKAPAPVTGADGWNILALIFRQRLQVLFLRLFRFYFDDSTGQKHKDFNFKLILIFFTFSRSKAASLFFWEKRRDIKQSSSDCARADAVALSWHKK